MANKFPSLGFTDAESAILERVAANLGVNPYAVAAVAYNAHALGSIDSITITSVTAAYRSATRSYVGA